MSEQTKPNTTSWSQISKGILVLIFGSSLGLGIAYFFVRPKMNRAHAETMLVMTGGKPAADAWLADVRSGDLARAHEATTPAFRGRLDRAKFEELVANHPALKSAPVIKNWTSQGGSTSFSIGLDGIRFQSAPSVFTLKGRLSPPEGAAEDFELVILKDADGDRLLVDRIDFEPAPPPAAKP